MRTLVACIVFVGCHSVTVAQAPAAPPVDPQLLAHLRAWEQAMTTSQSFYSPCSAVRINTAAKTQDAFSGFVMCLKPGFARTRINLQPVAGQDPASTQGVYEEYVITPTAVHEYTGDGIDRATGKPKVQNYAITEFPAGQKPPNVMLDFLSGTMTAEMALQRFDIQLVKADTNYIYLAILPRTPIDKMDFEAMTMALYQPATKFAYLPAMVRFTKDALGQRTEEWSFTAPTLNHPDLVPQKFAPQPIAATDPAWKVTRRVGGLGQLPMGRPRR